MTSTTFARFFALGLTALTIMACSSSMLYFPLLTSIGFGHYLISLMYSRRRIARSVGSPRAVTASLVILALGTAIFVFNVWAFEGPYFKLLLFFGLHHLLNEYHVSTAGIQAPDGVGILRASSMLLHGALYLLVVVNDNEMAVFNRDWLLVAALVSAGLYSVALLRLRSHLRPGQLFEASIFEGALGLLALAAYSGVVYVRFIDVVLFHFLFWVFFPMPKIMAAQGRSGMGRYVGLTVVTTAGFLLVSPIGLFPSKFETSLFHLFFLLASYFHITVSFALSEANPRWITRWFSVRPTAVVPARAIAA